MAWAGLLWNSYKGTRENGATLGMRMAPFSCTEQGSSVREDFRSIVALRLTAMTDQQKRYWQYVGIAILGAVTLACVVYAVVTSGQSGWGTQVFK